MQAIILAGGFGTRLAPLVPNVPKAMAPVSGLPFLHWLLSYMQEQGVTGAVLCVHHLHDRIRDYFGGRFGAIDLYYNVEEIPLGTGGALKRALSRLDDSEPVLALNGDSMVRLDYRRLMETHARAGRPMTIAAASAPDCHRYSTLSVNDGVAEAFALHGTSQPGLISTGVYALSPDLFDAFALPPSFSFERDFLLPQTPKLKPAVYEGVESFIDIGVPEDYENAQSLVPGLSFA